METLISSVFNRYSEFEIILAGLSKKTDEQYHNAKKLAVNFFSDVSIENITLEDIRDYYSHLLTWQKPDTARLNIICLRSVLRYCRKNGLKVIDADNIKVPKRQKRVIKYLTNIEVQEFIKVVGQHRRGYNSINRLRNVAIVKLIYYSGMRVGEVCRLNKNSFRDGQTTVVGKSRDSRIVFITNEVQRSIDKYLKARDDDCEALFVSQQTGKRITAGTIRRIFENACNRSDFNNVHPHILRHSFATTLLDRRVDIRYIGDLLGHVSLDTTKEYTHYSNPKLKEIYKKALT